MVVLAATTEETGSAGSNKTDLLSGRSVSGDSRRVTNVLVVTTTVGVIDGVHGNASDTGPSLSLGLILVVGVTGLEHGLIGTATTGDETDNSAASRGQGFLGTRGKTHTSLGTILGLANDDSVAARSTGDLTTVSHMSLNAGCDSTLGDLTEGEDVTGGESSLLTAVHELAGVEALNSDEELLLLRVLDRVAEFNLGKGSATTGIVHDLLDQATDVTLALSEIQSAELSSALTLGSVGGENGPSTLTLT